jgi:hypothetical protein
MIFYTYIHTHTHIHTKREREKENMNALVHLSEGTKGGRREEKNVRE